MADAPDLQAAAAAALEILDAVIHSIGGDVRPGQREMGAAVAQAIAAQHHLLVEAPTGVGKSLAYAAAVAASGRVTVVTTSTKALQEQLVTKDLPAVAAVAPGGLTFALLKGRSNYLCVARASESMGRDVLGTGSPVHHPTQLEGLSRIEPSVAEQLRAWIAATETGDRADLPQEVGDGVWEAVSVSSLECPGATSCHRGEECFAEAAGDRAAAADVVVVNTHLYAHHLRSGGHVLPPHDVVIVDEAHDLADIATEVFGVVVGGGRFSFVANRATSVVPDAAELVGGLRRAGDRLDDAIAAIGHEAADPTDPDLAAAILAGRESLAELRRATSELDKPQLELSDRTSLQALVTAAAGLDGDLLRITSPTDTEVLWIDDGARPRLRLSPIEVGPSLTDSLFRSATVVCTSATLRAGPDFGPTAEALGLRLVDAMGEAPPGDPEEGASDVPPPVTALLVDSPFDHRAQALLYVPRHLPDPRHPDHGDAAFAEMLGLVEAAGGRALLLHTSHRALRATAERLRDKGPWELLVQDDLPRPVLVERFCSEPSSCLVATMGFWQGIDAPGDVCTLVVIDRLPFPRPDHPLLAARRQLAEAAGRNGWQAVDLPKAATLLAQGAGRLIRSITDRGVVAVLDPRLATKGYRRTLLGPVPPFRRTVDGDEARAYLASIAGSAVATPVAGHS